MPLSHTINSPPRSDPFARFNTAQSLLPAVRAPPYCVVPVPVDTLHLTCTLQRATGHIWLRGDGGCSSSQLNVTKLNRVRITYLAPILCSQTWHRSCPQAFSSHGISFRCTVDNNLWFCRRKSRNSCMQLADERAS